MQLAQSLGMGEASESDRGGVGSGSLDLLELCREMSEASKASSVVSCTDQVRRLVMSAAGADMVLNVCVFRKVQVPSGSQTPNGRCLRHPPQALHIESVGNRTRR